MLPYVATNDYTLYIANYKSDQLIRVKIAHATYVHMYKLSLSVGRFDI